MEFAIKNKWFSMGGSSIIQDTQGNDVMKAKGKVFSFTKKKFLTDMNGDLKFVIRNKFWRLFTYRALIFDPEGKQVAMLRRKIFSFHDRYFVTSDLGDMKIIGNFLQFNYRIILNGVEIGHVARKISLRDSFVLTADDAYDPAFMVALVIAVDNITDRKDKDNAAAAGAGGVAAWGSSRNR